ncbi:hypothetical protein EDD17DRAFT_1516403 [Pisolithus thermaeus]|nr:hypothetical protein EV401DRAFT_1895986 [Pisolithus croceorrhizus]KAI6140362.1 hypothetical protein EDD17DRAFT_1516403 [Pisolithus thermaeus]
MRLEAHGLRHRIQTSTSVPHNSGPPFSPRISNPTAFQALSFLPLFPFTLVEWCLRNRVAQQFKYWLLGGNYSLLCRTGFDLGGMPGHLIGPLPGRALMLYPYSAHVFPSNRPLCERPALQIPLIHSRDALVDCTGLLAPQVILILRKNFPLIYSPQCGEVLQSTVTPACSGVPCLSPSGEVHGTTPAGWLDSPLSSLSSCGEADRTPPVGRPDSRAPNPSDKADRTTHPGPSDSSMSNSLSVSSMLQIPTLDHEPTPLTSVPATLPSGAAPMLTESVPVTRTSTKIHGVDHHFTLFLSTGSRPLMAPDPVMLANSGDLYLHQHHLNTQIWVKEASGWVIGRCCGKMTDHDPSTGNEVTGLYVTAPVYKTHARNDKQLTLLGASPSMAKSRVRESTREQQEEKILAETLFHPGHTDTLVSAPYNDAPHVHKAPGAQKDPTVHSDGSDKPTDCTAESLLPNLQGVIPNQNSLKISRSHTVLDRLEKRLSLLKKNFRYPSLTFPKDPNSVTDPLPQLLFTSRQQSSNMEFLTHQDQIAALASEADTVQTHGDQELEEKRTNVISKLWKEQAYLNGIIAEQWQLKKVENGFISNQGQPHIIQTGVIY